MKYYLYVGFLIILSLLLSVLFFQQKTSKDKLEELRTYVIEEFTQDLALEKEELLSFALALSENSEIKNALSQNDSRQGNRILTMLATKFRTHTSIKNLNLQIFDANFSVLAQNWKKIPSTKSLTSFRIDLDRLRKSKKPKVGTETGRRLTFKATIPLMVGEKNVIGYLELIKFLDEFTDQLRNKGIELFALMNPKYKTIDSLMDNFSLLNEYIIVNENFNFLFREKALTIDWKELKSSGYLPSAGKLFLLHPMYNGEHKKIGEYLLILNSTTLEEYKKRYQDTSFFRRFSHKEIYNFVKISERTNETYEQSQDRELLELLPQFNKKDQQDVKHYLKERFNKYKRRELIDFILNNRHIEKKVGEIQ